MNAEALRALSPEERALRLGRLNRAELELLGSSWAFWARPEQVPPDGDWFVYLLLAGRGFGKTRCGAEWVRGQAKKYPGSRWALVSKTVADVRDTMAEGASGLQACMPKHELWKGDWDKAWNRSLLELRFANGSYVKGYSSEEPDRLRGPQFHGAWGDEPAKWADCMEGMTQDSTYSQLAFGVRLPLPDRTPNRIVLTGTPKPVKLIKQLVSLARSGQGRVILNDPRTAGSDRNLANLSASFRLNVLDPLRGTRLGRQEIAAELLVDNPGALWTTAVIDGSRRPRPDLGQFSRIVVALDPAGSIGDMARFAASIELSDKNDGDDAGIVAVGLHEDGHLYVLADATTGGAPDRWGRAAVSLYHTLSADRVVGESNHGGDNVRGVIQAVDPFCAYEKVFASRGKLIRAEPVAALYAQGKVHHCGEFPELERELTEWEPGMPSPNRMDSLCIACAALSGNTGIVEDQPDPFGGQRF